MPLLFELGCVIDGYNSKAPTESPFKTSFKDFGPELKKDACADDSQATWKPFKLNDFFSLLSTLIRSENMNK